ncbi:MAG: hypothetical protein WD512_01355 [Candidatus Paceibacterota bacterium]
MGYKRILVETENKNYVRDIKSRALLSSNKEEMENYKVKSKMMNKNKELGDRLNILESSMEEIKSLLKELIK